MRLKKLTARKENKSYKSIRDQKQFKETVYFAFNCSVMSCHVMLCFMLCQELFFKVLFIRVKES